MTKILREITRLGRTQIEVTRLGMGSCWGASAHVFEEAYERGANYFLWGSLRREGMRNAIRHIGRAQREDLVIALESYARWPWALQKSVEHGLRSLGTPYIDVLLLGWHGSVPDARLLDAAFQLVELGRVRHMGVSSPNDAAFQGFLRDPRLEVWHVRHNAVSRGAERTVFPLVNEVPQRDRPGIVSYTATRWGSLCDPGLMPRGEPTPTGIDCYRFALSQPLVDVVMAGPANAAEARQAMDALALGPMNEAELAWMRRVGDYVYRRGNDGGPIARAHEILRHGRQWWRAVRGR